MLDETSEDALSVEAEELDIVSEMVGEIGPKLEKKKDLASDPRDFVPDPLESIPEESAADVTFSLMPWSTLTPGVLASPPWKLDLPLVVDRASAPL